MNKKSIDQVAFQESMMIARKIESELDYLSREYKIITITGPRQSGKTTLARMHFPDYEYINLEDPEARLMAETDPHEFLRRHPAPAILDEIQRVPTLLSSLQVLCDENPAPAQYILTGSHQPRLQAGISQSLAGRTAILHLLPLSIAELAEAGVSLDRDEYIHRGFMPAIYENNLDPFRYYRNYFKTYVERDARQLVNLRHFHAFELFMRLLAGRIGQLLNLNSLSNDVGVSSTTLSDWLSILEASHLIFRLPPYFKNFGKRLVKTPKIYFTEVGLAAYLLDLETPEMVTRDPLLGGLFENMVVLEAVKARFNAGRDAGCYFFRDSNGLEVDLLFARQQQLFPIEIKSARTYTEQFAAGIRKFIKFCECSADGTVLYAGESSQKLQDISLLNFRETSKIGSGQ